MENKFYLSKGSDYSKNLFFGYSWKTGAIESTGDGNVGSTFKINVNGFKRFFVETDYTYATSSILHYFNAEETIIKSVKKDICKRDDEIPEGVEYVAVEINFSKNYSGYNREFGHKLLKEVKPHYKSLSKHFAKESNQVFFRESIEGKVNLWRQDYMLVKNASLEDTFEFYIYRNGSRYAVNEFNKTDCKYDHSKGSVELKLSPKDKYTKVLNGYGKTHDLLKLPIRKSMAQLTKRSIVQMYLQGGNTISNYGSGTYWEEEVINPINNANDLENKYHFSKCPQFVDVRLDGFNWSINGIYGYNEGASVCNNASGKGSIVFRKVYSAGYTASGNAYDESTIPPNAFKLSDATTPAFESWGSQGGGAHKRYLYDTYRIELYSEMNGGGQKLYESKHLFGNDSNFVLSIGSNKYEMVSISQTVPYKDPEPQTFFLGDKIITHQIWARLLCDVDYSSDGRALYNVPVDDFVSEQSNFKKCIGLQITQGGSTYVKIVQSASTSDEPTPYGINDSGQYFTAPDVCGANGRIFPYPFIRSAWANTSLWVAFEENNGTTGLPNLESLLSKYYKAIKHKDCMEIGAVIKAILSKIDSSIKFEATSEYSQFLYGSQFSGSIGAKGLKVLITQKSNVLKGEYDQAAQKVETTFEQVMNMLNKCFKCYWYIDGNNRFRVEHISYFLNGKSYSSASLQYDLTAKCDKFNKKTALYGQNEATFNKSDLNSRYEFAWSDETSEALGGGFSVDVISNYVQMDKTESINVEAFTPDIDLMMFAPSRFSQYGFALIITDSNYKVPIVYKEIYNQKNELAPVKLNVQNYYASFIHLFNYYLHDMPARTIRASSEKDSSEKDYFVSGIKKCMASEIQFIPESEPDIYKLIGTELGNGTIDDMTIDIDKGVVKASLSFEPK